MYYIVVDNENNKLNFFNEKNFTLFKNKKQAETCVGNFTFTLDDVEIVNPLESYLRVIPYKSSLYSILYFLKEDLSRFFFNIKYNKAYYFDSIFKTNIQKFVIKD